MPMSMTQLILAILWILFLVTSFVLSWTAVPGYYVLSTYICMWLAWIAYGAVTFGRARRRH